MTPFEWLALIYFAAVPLAAARHARPRGWLYAAGAILLVIVARLAAPWEARAWLPHAYLMLGYWIPAAFTRGINPRFETWLTNADERLDARLRAADAPRRPTGDPMAAESPQSARGSWRPSHLLELAYLLCYPLVPAAFTIVFLLGTPEDVVRFWIAVLAAGYACYWSLPWTAARPPRLVSPREATLLAGINAHVLGRVSHNMNTFPSGHVAVSLAASLAVVWVSLAWGLGLLAMAVTIAVAAVNGRYHYLVDVLVGAGVAVAAVLIALAAGSGSFPA
jgi:membrane-associated phospholipid phosphatase